MYIDVHSAKYPDGEIRGQITPASWDYETREAQAGP